MATRNALIMGLAFGWLAACSNDQTPPPTGATMPVSAPDSGVELANFDQRVAPGDDFYRYVNGRWLDTTPIPSDRSNYGVFTALADEAEENLRRIIDEAQSSQAPEGSDLQKVGDMYRSFMDEARLASVGLGELQSWLERIQTTESHEALWLLSAELNHLGMQVPVAVYVDIDARQSDQYIAYLSQSGLGLPDRDWYLSDDNETHENARQAYGRYVERLMQLAGHEAPERVAGSIMSIEEPIAAAHWDRVRNRQRELTYNKMDLDELASLAPILDWSGYLSALGVSEDAVVVRQPDFVSQWAAHWQDTPLQAWQDYFSFKLIDAYADYLDNDFVEARFDFQGRVLGGLEEMRPRWKRGVALVEGSLGEVLGRLYVERHFNQDAKARMDELVENLREAFRQGIDELDWMTEATKEEAQEKLRRFTAKIGYPDAWKDYSALDVSADDLLGNVMRSRQVEHEREVSKLGQPIDRGEWFMTPQTVNAYYYPAMNEVVFPAAILQPPFFNVDADDAVNYGAIVAVIGHEFSHGFDDQGRKSDGDGNLRDWWTEEDAEAFAERASALVEQFNTFEVLPGRFLNGEFTLGENIGDLSGLAMAYKAYQLSLDGQPAPVLDGFTGDQRFFIGWAQVWRRLYRDEDLEMRLTNDPHSHSEARTNGIVRNFDAWYEAFSVEEDAELYLPPEERVRIW